VGAALEARLGESDGPEIVVVSRLTEEGWLEENTMGLLRAHLKERLSNADRDGRYRLLYPYVPHLERPNLLNVHSKVLVMDDELASVGSANFNNRSMGFDTECNIAIEAHGDERIRKAIAGLRNRLLAEHLGTTPGAIASSIAREHSLVKTIEVLHRPGERTLEPIDSIVDSKLERLLPASALVDPERPVSLERLVTELVPEEGRRSMAERVVRVTAAMLGLAVLGVAWRFTALHDWIALGPIITAAKANATSLWTALTVLACYALGGILAVPITALIAVTGLLFGPVMGGTYALAGALLNAAITYWEGRLLGRDAVRRLVGSRLNRITRRLQGHGALTIAALRLLPVASSSKVNAAAGASHVRLRDFMLGSALGMTPGIVLIVTFVDRVSAAITDPQATTYFQLAALGLIVAAAAVAVWRRFGRQAVQAVQS
jgi:uncharacterized membrane protein YdjX (TVP38/TMEM64 family)